MLELFVLLWSRVFSVVQSTDYLILGLLIGNRMIQILLLSPFRGQDKKIHTQHIAKWLLMLCVEGGAFGLMVVQYEMNGVSMVCVIDIIVFCLQFLFQW